MRLLLIIPEADEACGTGAFCAGSCNEYSNYIDWSFEPDASTLETRQNKLYPCCVRHAATGRPTCDYRHAIILALFVIHELKLRFH